MHWELDLLESEFGEPVTAISLTHSVNQASPFGSIEPYVCVMAPAFILQPKLPPDVLRVGYNGGKLRCDVLR